MKEERTILVIPGWYPSPRSTANGDFIARQVRLLRAEGLHIDLAYADLSIRNLKNRQFKNVEIIKYNQNGKDYLLTGPSWPRNNGISLKSYCQSFAQFIEKKFQDRKPDIIHAHNYLGGQVGLILKKKWSIPLIVTEHDSSLIDNSMKIYHWKLANKVYESADEVIAVSSSLARCIATRGTRIPKVMPNFIDMGLFNRNSANRLKGHIVSIGEFIDRKNFIMLLAAFKKFQSFLPETSLTIIGDGPLRPLLKQQIIALGIENKVCLSGRIGESEVAELLQTADVYIHPSKSESFGIVLIEALSCGVPVISFKNGGSEDIITNENGILIDQVSEDLLLKAMIDYFNNDLGFNRDQISIDTISKYGSKRAANQLTLLYNSLV